MKRVKVKHYDVIVQFHLKDETFEIPASKHNLSENIPFFETWSKFTETSTKLKEAKTNDSSLESSLKSLDSSPRIENTNAFSTPLSAPTIEIILDLPEDTKESCEFILERIHTLESFKTIADRFNENRDTNEIIKIWRGVLMRCHIWNVPASLFEDDTLAFLRKPIQTSPIVVFEMLGKLPFDIPDEFMNAIAKKINILSLKTELGTLRFKDVKYLLNNFDNQTDRLLWLCIWIIDCENLVNKQYAQDIKEMKSGITGIDERMKYFIGSLNRELLNGLITWINVCGRIVRCVFLQYILKSNYIRELLGNYLIGIINNVAYETSLKMSDNNTIQFRGMILKTERKSGTEVQISIDNERYRLDEIQLENVDDPLLIEYKCTPSTFTEYQKIRIRFNSKYPFNIPWPDYEPHVHLLIKKGM